MILSKGRRCEMRVTDTVDREQKQMLLALHHSQEAVLDVLDLFRDRIRRMTGELPYVDRRPTVREVVEQWFGFAEDVLKEEREFVLHVLDRLPERTVTPPVVKETRKAA